MDEFAEQQGIAFAEWISGFETVHDGDGHWDIIGGELCGKTFTTSELYQLFIKQNQPKTIQ